MNLALTGILVYVLAQLAIAVAVARRVNNESDYLLAGRRINLPFATFTIFATWFGAETCIGAAGQVYAGGIGNSTADPFGYALCLLFFGLVFSVPLWRRQLTTLADLFRQRFSPGVERFVALLLVPTSVLWAAAQIRALGQIVASTGALEVELAIAVAAGVVVIYTVYGGLLANAATDLVQGIMVIAGLVAVLLAVVSAAGGWEAAVVSIDSSRLNLFSGSGAPWYAQLERWVVPVFGSVLAQEIVIVVLASRSQRVARAAPLLGGGMYFLVGLIPVTIGLVGAQLMPGLQEPEQIMPLMAQKYLSTGLYILFLGAIVSAILSTVSGALLATAALASHNVIAPLRPSLSIRGRVLAARLCVIAAGIGAYVIARHAGSIYELVEEASAFGTAGVFIAASFGLFTTFGRARAAYGALATGTITWLLGHYVLHLDTPYILALAVALTSYVALALTEPRAEPLPSMVRS